MFFVTFGRCRGSVSKGRPDSLSKISGKKSVFEEDEALYLSYTAFCRDRMLSVAQEVSRTQPG